MKSISLKANVPKKVINNLHLFVNEVIVAGEEKRKTKTKLVNLGPEIMDLHVVTNFFHYHKI